MIAIVVVFAMSVAALNVLWDGRVAVSSHYVVSGPPVKFVGFALLLAGPLALATREIFLAAVHSGRLPGFTADYDHSVFWCVLLIPPALAAVVALPFAQKVAVGKHFSRRQ